MPPFEQAWASYAAELRRRRAFDTTVQQYRIRLVTFCTWVLRHRRVMWHEAGPDDLDAFCDRRCLPRMVHAGQPLAPASRTVYATSVPLFYHHLYAAGLLDRDAFAGYLPPPAPPPHPRTVDTRAVAALLRHCDGHPDRRLAVLARLGCVNGLRMGETAALTVDGLDLGADEPTMLVVGKGRVHPVVLPVHRSLVPVLGRYTYWLAGQVGVPSPWDLPAGVPLIQSRTRPGCGVGPKYPSKLMARTIREVEMDGRPVRLRPHNLRGWAIQQAAKAAKGNPGPAQLVARHARPETLRHYVPWDVESAREAFGTIPDPAEMERREQEG